jgi:hypothetical protein
VPRIRALLADGVDDAGHGGAVFGIELARDHLELLNGFQRWPRLRAGAPAAQIVVVAAAIELVDDAAAVLPVDGHAVGGGIRRGVVDYARQQTDHAREIARA